MAYEWLHNQMPILTYDCKLKLGPILQRWSRGHNVQGQCQELKKKQTLCQDQRTNFLRRDVSVNYIKLVLPISPQEHFTQ